MYKSQKEKRTRYFKSQTTDPSKLRCVHILNTILNTVYMYSMCGDVYTIQSVKKKTYRVNIKYEKTLVVVILILI